MCSRTAWPLSAARASEGSPARACAALTGVVAGQPGEAWRIWQRDAPGHPSPNAGPVEASFAGALGVRLGGTNSYGDEVENRGTYGDGPRPQVPDIRRTADLARSVALAATGLAMILASRSLRKSVGTREVRWT